MRRVRDVMTAEVVVVRDRTPFKEIVGLMRQHNVSALPVVDATDELVGIVSEADLLLKEEHVAEGESHRRFQSRRRRIDRAKAGGVIARELMSSSVETIDPEAPLARAARLLHERRVKRLPVVDANGKLVGIVSRADLLKVFLARTATSATRSRTHSRGRRSSLVRSVSRLWMASRRSRGGPS
jgi:CBS domain-containing protein